MTPSEEITSRYNRVERESDARGRIIGVRKLKVSQQLRVAEMTPGLEGLSEISITDKETGEERTVKMDRRSIPLLAASVCEIDRVPIPFPKTRGELDAIMDSLDEDGIAAALAAAMKMQPKKAAEDENESLSGIDEAKK